MNKTVKVLFLPLIISVFTFAQIFVIGGCDNRKIKTGNIGVVKDEEFNNVYIELTIDEFNALGFAFGDSVDISFDNGKSFKDVPYYSGYYVPVGELLCCGYPGYPHVVIARNYGKSTWEEFEMSENSKVEITLNQKGKYIETQELYNLHYEDEKREGESDEMFANFRAVCGGDLAENYFYRSASPCDNQHNRAAYANDLASEYGIGFVLNLSDSEEKYQAHKAKSDFSSEYYDGLVQGGKVKLLALNANYRPEDSNLSLTVSRGLFADKFSGELYDANAFVNKLSQAFYEMTTQDGKILIHCVEGKDRTGFACALLLALADATADEIIDDYMITYYNYYGITKESMPKKYEAILGNVYDFFYCMCDADKGTPVNTLNLKQGAENYLKKGGLSDTQIEEIETYIAAKPNA